MSLNERKKPTQSNEIKKNRQYTYTFRHVRELIVKTSEREHCDARRMNNRESNFLRNVPSENRRQSEVNDVKGLWLLNLDHHIKAWHLQAHSARFYIRNLIE